MKPPEIHKDSYKERISRASKEHNSRIILAIDLEGGTPQKLAVQGKNLLKRTVEHICAAKLGRQTVLNLGTQRTHRLIGIAKGNGIPVIIDDKLNDIGETNRSIARAYFRIGFDGLTANPLTGWKDGLQPVFHLAHAQGMGVILLTYMSHRGALESYGQRVFATGDRVAHFQYELFARKAIRWKADGAVVGATRPRIISEVKQILRDQIPIYSPGVGAQGGQLKTALKAGTDYFIIGRSITRAASPESAAAGYAKQSIGQVI